MFTSLFYFFEIVIKLFGNNIVILTSFEDAVKKKK